MDRGIYPDELAERLKVHAGERYRPSNGMEGMMFEQRYCDRCKRDRPFRDGTGDSCVILSNALAFGIDEPGYPDEWQYGKDGQPTCTAFEELDDGQDSR